MNARLWALVVVGAFLDNAALAQQSATIELSVYPEAVVADGNSTVTVSATVRDRSGNYVPDGTDVTFTASLGQFREAVVQTAGGVARATLISGNVPGVSKVTASVVNFAAVGGIEIGFVESDSELRKTTVYVDATGDLYLAYAVDIQLIAATGTERGARVAYRDVEIEADDLQVWLGEMRVVAYNAKLTVGSSSLEAAELSYRLRGKEGLAVIEQDGAQQLVQLKGTDAETLHRPPGYNDFRFQELLDSTTVILAGRIVANPGREVLFNRAQVYVGPNKLFSMPHYSVDLTRPGGLFNDQMFGINQDGLSLDIPYYLSLSPRQSNSLRLRSQHTGGRTYTNSRGTSLDWVTKYSDGVDYSGDFTINDMASDRWGMTLRHTHSFGNALDGHFVLDSPRHDSLFGYAQFSKQFGGFHASASLSGRQGFRDTVSNDRRADISVETNSTPLFNRALFHSFGLAANYRMLESSTGRSVRQGYGLRYRLRTAPMQFGVGSLSAGATITKFWGGDVGDGIGVLGTVTSTLALTPTTTLALTYDYSQDQLGYSLLGKHRLTAQLFTGIGSFDTALFVSKGLDLGYLTVFGDASLRLSRLWRVGFGYTWSDNLVSSFTDQYILLGYRLGFREVAVRWSSLDRRFGIELLAAGF